MADSIASMATTERRLVLRGGVAWIAVGILIAHCIALVVLAHSTGTTVDEPILLSGGRLIVEQGWSDPYTRFQGPLALYANQLFAHGHDVGPFPAAETIFLGRLGVIPFSLLLGAVIFLWARAAFGPCPALLALVLWASHPMMLGYGALMAVDIAHASVVLLALFLTWRYYQAPSVMRLIFVGLAMGASLATKYLAVLFLPAIALILCVGTWHACRASYVRRVLLVAGTCCAASLLALIALHACYGFRTGCAVSGSVEYSSALLQGLSEMPLVGTLMGVMPRAFLEGIDYQSNIATDVITTYFNGRLGRGHSAYYVGALAWKSPEVQLFCWVAAVLLMTMRAHRVPSAARSTWIVVLLSIAGPLAYLSWFNPLQIGIRYALPVIPLLILLSASAIMTLGSRTATLFLVLVSAVSLIEVRASWPEMLGYYNRMSGGPELAWHRFADSNSDWGHLRERGLEVLRARHGNDFQVLSKHDGPRLGRVALYVDDLVRPDPRDGSRSYSWLDPFHPIDHVGAAWFLFEVDSTSIRAQSQDAEDPARHRDCAVALLGAGMRTEAARAIRATEGADRKELEALWELEQNQVAPDLAHALHRSQLWSQFERHDLAALVIDDPAFRATIDARQRLVEIRVQQQDRQTAIRLLEQDAALTASEQNFLLLVVLYYQVARYGDAIAMLREGRHRLPSELQPAIELQLAECERMLALGQRYHQDLR